MKFTYHWLKDFVEIKIPPQKLAELLTMSGLEVTSLKNKDDDWIFEVEVTSNRPDLLSVLGIAREVCAITKSKIKMQKLIADSVERLAYSLSNKKFKINIESKRDCPLYTAKIIKEVKVGPSVDWLKERLELIGCRSVNNVVDITNYVMFSLGQPLHAFDLDKLNGNFICVRRAKEGETITTIDGKSFNLDKDILVIADSQKPIAIAGIMGGKDTEVNFDTKNILLESAKFNPLLIRRMRQKLGLVSESQYRFERDVDIENVIFASFYATYLIENIAKGVLIGSKNTPYKRKRKKIIVFNYGKVDKILGVHIKKEEIKKIFKKLDFKIKELKDKLKIEIPSFRKDIKEEIDLIEEVSRIWGYDRIPHTFPYIKPLTDLDISQKIIFKLKNLLINQGFFEVINYSLISKQVLKDLKINSLEDLTSIANPLSNQQEILRPLLLAGLLYNVSRNIRYNEGVLVFEIGKVFEGLDEFNHLGLALCGKKVFFKDSGKVEDNLNIQHLKGEVQLILENLGIKNFDFVYKKEPYLEIGFKVVVDKEEIGYLGKVDKEVGDNFDIPKKDVFVAELNLDNLRRFVDLNKKYKPLPVYPIVRRDISLAINEKVSLKEVLKRIKEVGFPLLKEVEIIDFYKGSPIPSGFRGITLSCLYYAQRTLTEEEVDSLHLKIRDILKNEFSVQLR